MKKIIEITDRDLIQFSLTDMCAIATLKSIVQYILFDKNNAGAVYKILDNFHLINKSPEVTITRKVSFSFENSHAFDIWQNPVLDINSNPVTVINPKSEYRSGKFYIAAIPIAIAKNPNIDIYYQDLSIDSSLIKGNSNDTIIKLDDGYTILLDTLSQQLNNSIASEPVLTKIAEFMSRYVIKYQPNYSNQSELQKKITDYLADRGIPCKLISFAHPEPIDIYLKFQAIPEVYLDNYNEEINIISSFENSEISFEQLRAIAAQQT